MKVLEKENYLYTFEYDEETGEYFLEVECGTIAVYDLKIKLTDEEIAKYKNDSKFIRELALQVSSSPKNYDSRHVRKY